MQISNSEQELRSHPPVWVLLTETLLSDFLSDHDKAGELAAGALFQKLRAMGMPRENLESIDRMLAGFAEEALADFKPGSLELPGRVRVFCQPKMIGAANSAQTARLHAAEQGMKQAQLFHPSGTKMTGGWGCFLIKRRGDAAEEASLSSEHFVDLYLYREG